MKNHPNNYPKPYHCEMKHIRNRSSILSEERLVFLDGCRLGEVDIHIERNAVVRKVRRIMEKRICQEYWKRRSRTGDNGDRHRMRRNISNHLKNIYGSVPVGFSLK